MTSPRGETMPAVAAMSCQPDRRQAWVAFTLNQATKAGSVKKRIIKQTNLQQDSFTTLKWSFLKRQWC